MISMGPIGHSICSNYRKPMKILFYLRLVQVRRALPNPGSDSGVAAPPAAPLHSIQSLAIANSIAVVIPVSPSSLAPSLKSAYFLTRLFDILLIQRYSYRTYDELDKRRDG